MARCVHGLRHDRFSRILRAECHAQGKRWVTLGSRIVDPGEPGHVPGYDTYRVSCDVVEGQGAEQWHDRVLRKAAGSVYTIGEVVTHRRDAVDPQSESFAARHPIEGFHAYLTRKEPRA